MKLSAYIEQVKANKINLDGEDYYRANDVNEVLSDIDQILRDVNDKIDDITTELY